MPELPIGVIAVDPRGFVEALTTLDETKHTSAYAFHRKWWKGISFFHRDGQRYEVTNVVPDRPRGFFSHLLAATVYNPRFMAAYSYRATGPYTSVDFQRAMEAAIKADDDVLTQFHDEQELLKRLAGTSSFDDMLAFVRYMQVPDDAA